MKKLSYLEIMPDFEYTIIGAGVVGLALAERLSAKSRFVAVLEKNAHYGQETSSRNSEVIHAGIYYEPGSLKATLCVEGRELLYEICQKNGIAHNASGKIITATTVSELKTLDVLFERGRLNGATLQTLTREETLKLEPSINTAGSLFSPRSGVVSAHELMDYFFRRAVDRGATIQLHCEVTGIRKQRDGFEITIQEPGGSSVITSEKVVNAAGLYSDKIAGLAGIDVDQAGYRLSFAKGSYFAVIPSKSGLVRRLVYPVPQNEGLGVHALRDWGGRLKFGPDVEYLEGPVFDYRVEETKLHAFGESIRKILPQIHDEDLTPDMSGIRPKLQKRGEPPRDFLIRHEADRGLVGFVNLIGIDSPGLTASPAIARYVERLVA